MLRCVLHLRDVECLRCIGSISVESMTKACAFITFVCLCLFVSQRLKSHKTQIIELRELLPCDAVYRVRVRVLVTSRHSSRIRTVIIYTSFTSCCIGQYHAHEVDTYKYDGCSSNSTSRYLKLYPRALLLSVPVLELYM